MDNIVQSSVVHNLSRRPATVTVGPFVIGWDPTTDSRFVNCATPLVGAAFTPADVAELVAAFRRIERVPRLEYVTSCAPELERHLLDAGFAVEARNEYLTCSPRTLRTPAGPPGVKIGEPVTDEERASVVTAQHAAFGSDRVAGPDDVARIHNAQRDGGVLLYARDAEGTYLGGALATAPWTDPHPAEHGAPGPASTGAGAGAHAVGEDRQTRPRPAPVPWSATNDVIHTSAEFQLMAYSLVE
ncbi:hypothetical protein [Actinopolymorpha singaporensis]|uniref:Uncharacterized protein n=1 Tax=Actinopolymorpha singaporensis TaxID=117157 RepID=A0A1H1TGJ2_9ACTN|nr:hypothetical protein [Actinopolymorpha singaporensis]SDS59362.1 hypothetical protein SAMN04489717_3188 [Actinopolymorpha singaporensis]